MESKSLFDLLAKLNPTDEQLKEFFIYYTAQLNKIQLEGIFYGMELCGKDMNCEEGQKVKKEITKLYDDKLPELCQNMINAFSRFIIKDAEEAINTLTENKEEENNNGEEAV